MANKEEETKTEEPKLRYELVEVPTQTAVVIKDNQTEKVYQIEQAMAEVLNILDEIKKNTG